MICPHCGGEMHIVGENERFARVRRIDDVVKIKSDEEFRAMFTTTSESNYAMTSLSGFVLRFKRIENKLNWWVISDERQSDVFRRFFWHTTWLDFNVAENNQAPVNPSVITTTNIRRITPRKSPNET